MEHVESSKYKSGMIFRCYKHMWYVDWLLAWALAFAIRFVKLQEAAETGATLFIVLWEIVFWYLIWQGLTGAIYYGKTIELRPEGCYISLWRFKKFYPWSYYETKLYQHKYKNFPGPGMDEGKSVLVFALHFRESYSFSPLFSILHTAPFSAFCLGYYVKTKRKSERMFEATEDTVETLSQWGVKIRNYKAQKTDERS